VKVTIDGWAWIDASKLTATQKRSLRQDLTVVPTKSREAAEEEVKEIYLYREEGGRFGIPRSYFYPRKKAEHEVEDNTSLGDVSVFRETPLQFNGALRDEQKRALQLTKDLHKAGHFGGVIKAVPGFGKCLGRGTPVLRYDGSIVPVEQLVPGDLLMGPDGAPRAVQSVSSGIGPLFRIVPTRGEPWVCNEDHILTLVSSYTRKKDEVIDISLKDFLALPERGVIRTRYKQFSPENGVDFCEAPPLPIDPYFMGVWYGDGTKWQLANVCISKPDPEIEALCREVAASYGLRVRVQPATDVRCNSYFIVGDGPKNPLLTKLREVVGSVETIPREYLVASRADREKFLAGYLDADGHHNNGCYDIVQKNINYIDGIAFIARSLGMSAIISPKEVDGELYWRCTLSGDFSRLPLRVPRKKPRARRQIKKATRTDFTVERLGVGEYFGFTLDGDGRFLLGDFTVTHNTVLACAIISELKTPTLVIVHKEFLLNQWKERIEQFLPDAKIGLIQQDVCDYKDKHIVLGMVHTLAGREFPQDILSYFGLVIADEVHRIGAFTWAKAPPKFSARFRIGLSATTKRKDRADNVFLYHIGPIYFESREIRLTPKIRRVYSNFAVASTPRFNPALAPRALLVKFLCANKTRNAQIIEQLIQAVQAGRKVLVLSERLKHLDELEKLLNFSWRAEYGPRPTTGKYVGGMSEEALEESETKQVIFATVQYAAEGLDIAPLDTLFLTTPMVDVTQAVGRILRPYEGKKDPVVVDFKDDRVPMFKNFAEARERNYKKIIEGRT